MNCGPFVLPEVSGEAVKEPAQLMPVDRIVRSVEVEHDLFRWLGMQRQKRFDEERLDVAAPGDDLLLARVCPETGLSLQFGGISWGKSPRR